MTTTPGRGDDIDNIVRTLRGARRVTAICHENPDADTIGAAIALSLLAARLGAETEVVSADEIPSALAFLPGVADFRSRPELAPDVAVVCDAATLERVGRMAQDHAAWFAQSRVLNIDHHVSNSRFGDLNLVDPDAAATCELVARIVERAAVALDGKLATALLAGIVRDTHGFSDGATSGDTLRTAARLVDAGAPLARIQRAIIAELPYPRLALWGRLLAGVHSAADGRILFTTLTGPMLADTGTRQPDADGFVEFLARSGGAEVTMLVRELAPSATRVSIRTSEAVNAAEIAGPFGGGGHARRAGWISDADATTELPRILAACLTALE